MTMKKILITGAAGFIGSHLAESLIKLGHSVLGIDNFSNGKKENIDYLKSCENSNLFSFIEGDLRDVNFCNEIVTDIEVIYHQAALGSVPRSMNEPQLYFDNNLGGMVNLLEASRQSSIERFIFASSSSVYGDTPILPKVETMPLNPKSPYAASKAAGEQYLKVYQDSFGLETIGFRYFNVFGPRQDPFSQYAAVIPRFFDQVLSNKPITIYGNGEQTRDFTFIDNVVAININAMFANKESTGKVYNVGCNEQQSVLNLAKMIQEIIGVDSGLKFLDSRKGDVKDSLADIQEIQKYFDISSFINLEEGLKKTLSWYENTIKVTSIS